MESPTHSLNALLDQSGLDHSDEAIDSFIRAHSHRLSTPRLHEAEFWNKAQSQFIQRASDEDAGRAAYRPA